MTVLQSGLLLVRRQGRAVCGAAVGAVGLLSSLGRLLIVGDRQRWAIESHAPLVAFAQSPLGRLLLAALSVLVLYIEKDDLAYSFFLVLAACLYAYAPRYKAVILLAVTQGLILFRLFTSTDNFDSLIGTVAQQEALNAISLMQLAVLGHLIYLAFFLAVIAVVRHRQKSLLAQRPVICALIVEMILLVASLPGVLHGIARTLLWTFFLYYSAYIWFLIYAVVDQRSRAPASLTYQAGALHPFWAYKSIGLPYGKGTNFLTNVYAKNPQELAITQIKGLKLLIWCDVLYFIHGLLEHVLVKIWGVATLGENISSYLVDHPPVSAAEWLSVVWSQVDFVLWVAMWGNLAVAIARIAGFRLPRATWRPLESRTMLDYFNRIVYYFKELMVDLFFTPTFFKYFKKNPGWRMFFATFMAAGVGNAIYHFIRDIEIVADIGVEALFASYASYLFYSVVLASAIGISQVRLSMGYRPSNSLSGRVWSFFCVWGFVTVMRIFGDESRDHTLIERFTYCAHLFGVNLL